MNYEEWKTNYENELKQYRDENVRIVYTYQDEYDYYCNSPDWIMYGDFNYFVRKNTEEIPNIISEKYEEYMMDNIDIFEGFVNDEINTLHPYFDVDNTLNNMFRFNGFKNISIETLTEEESEIFENAKRKYKKDNKKIIERFGGYFND